MQIPLTSIKGLSAEEAKAQEAAFKKNGTDERARAGGDFRIGIGYGAMSLSNYVGSGCIGGRLPSMTFVIVVQTGNMYRSLRYSIIIVDAIFII